MELTVEEQILAQIEPREFIELMGWEMKKSGNYYRGTCPYHGGDNPSAFSFNLKKGHFYCATRCNHIGNFIQAYTKYKGITHKKAIQELAKWKGITVKGKKLALKPKPIEKEVEIDQKVTIQRLPDISNWEKKGLIPLKKHERFSKESIERFQIQEGIEGRYENRIVFPLFDHEGRWIANNGRWKGEDYDGINIPKYLYSPEPFLSRYILYGYHITKEAPYYLLHEGVTDVIKAFEYGYPAQAILGSYLSEEQVELIRLNPKPVYLGFDGDKAGMKATKQSIELLFQKHMTDVYVLLFPLEKDPGSVSKEKYDQVFQRKIPAFDYLLGIS